MRVLKLKIYRLFFLLLIITACKNESTRELPVDYIGFWYEIDIQNPLDPNFINEENVLYIYEDGDEIHYLLKIDEIRQEGKVEGSGYNINLISNEGGVLSLSTIYSTDPIKNNGITVSIEDAVSAIISYMQNDETLHPYMLQNRISALRNMTNPR